MVPRWELHQLPHTSTCSLPSKNKLSSRSFVKTFVFYRRYIDDIFGIWECHPDPIEDEAQWNAFKASLNDYHGLKWDTSPLIKSVDYLDLTIQIKGDRLVTTLYEKALNRYLYLPPHSCHPPGCITGLILENTHRIYTLCSDPADISHKLQLFYERLRNRGYQRKQIHPIFEKAALLAIQQKQHAVPMLISDTDLTSCKRIFLHLPYNKGDPPSYKFQKIWKSQVTAPRYCKPLSFLTNKEGNKIEVEQLTVAYSRPPNLGNLLSYRKITEAHGPPVSSFLD